MHADQITASKINMSDVRLATSEIYNSQTSVANCFNGTSNILEDHISKGKKDIYINK